MKTGDKIPEILGLDAQGRQVKASDYSGQPMIVYFYPKDNTPGCTAEACSLRDGFGELRARGYTVVGISRDSPASHERFAARHGLPFTLLSDATAEVSRSFGVWQKKKTAGREYMGTVRTTFVTDADHVVTHIITRVDTRDAAGQILRTIG